MLELLESKGKIFLDSNNHRYDIDNFDDSLPLRKLSDMNSKKKRTYVQAKRKAKMRLYIRRSVIIGVFVLVIITSIVVCFSFGNSNIDNSSVTNQTTDAPTEPETTEPLPTEYVEVTGPVKDDFFDKTIFVGDSITLGFSMYVEDQRSQGIDCLGKSYVFANGSLGYINSQEMPAGDSNSMLPLYKGKQQNVEDVVADFGAERVYIMLGMNDITYGDPDYVLGYTKTMIDKIKSKSPDVRICLETVTPRIEAFENAELSNEKIRKYNAELKEFAKTNDCSFIDLYSAVSDENGCLRNEYCSDPEAMGLHFSYAGSQVIVDYLRRYPDGI